MKEPSFHDWQPTGERWSRTGAWLFRCAKCGDKANKEAMDECRGEPVAAPDECGYCKQPMWRVEMRADGVPVHPRCHAEHAGDQRDD